MLALAVILVLIGAGAVMALVCVGIAAFLVGSGIVTTSVFAGIETRRPRTAFKVLSLQTGGPGGALTAAGIAWLTTLTGFIEAGGWPALATGGVVGLVLGVAFAALFNHTWGAVWDWLVARLGTDEEDTEPDETVNP
jgi:hypothetical protein